MSIDPETLEQHGEVTQEEVKKQYGQHTKQEKINQQRFQSDFSDLVSIIVNSKPFLLLLS